MISHLITLAIGLALGIVLAKIGWKNIWAALIAVAGAAGVTWADKLDWLDPTKWGG